MKLLLIFSVFLGMSVNLIYAQNLPDSANADSSTIETVNKPVVKDLWNTGFKVDSNDFNKGAIFSPLQLIQGKVPGFAINCLNINDPNPEIQTQLRGASSVYLSNKPLYIVNGIALDNADFIPVENIESVEVLKNISETALYGIRGVDGVIIINTKKSLPQRFTISYNTYGYVEKLGKSDYMTANEWRQLRTTWANSNYSDLRNYAKKPDYNANTDWLKEISQNKISQSHSLDFSGTSNKTSYNASFVYNNYDGIIQKIGNKMLSGQLYLSQLALKDKLQVSLFVIGTNREYSAINKSKYLNYWNSNIMHIANQYNPTVPANRADSTSYSSNPLQQLNNVTDSRTLNNTLANIALDYKLTENLKISTSYSTHKTVEKNSYLQISSGELVDETNELKEKIFTINLNYNKSINNHHVNVLLNYSNQQNAIESSSKDSIILIQGSSGYSNSTDYKITNTSASVKYDYKNRYFLSAGMAMEKSPLYKYQNSTEDYLSFRAGWSVANEEFLRNVSWINEFKLYAGYGVSKRQGSFDAIPNTLVNPDIHGEKLHESNLGIDVSLLTNRLNFSVDYYSRKTNDGVELKSTRSGSVLINDVEIKNNGWEFYMKSQPIINPIKWTLDFNISFNKNRILSDYDITGTGMVYQQFGSFYGYNFAGFSNNGDVLVFDKDGNAVSHNLALPVELIGNAMPKSFLGLTNSFQYKNFDLSISLRGALGFSVRNKEYYSRVDGGIYAVLESNLKKYIQTVDQRALLYNNAYDLETTDYAIEKGDYVKIDNITLSYNIPSLPHAIKNLKLYIGCNNVALFTKFKGGDPEMAGITGAYQGIYYRENYPYTRIFVLGLKCIL
jgi:TonB-linked SusC/RagA family outer membrane protein